MAEEQHVASARISVEMVFRGLAHYAQAVLDGETGGVIEYLVRHAAVLGIIKRTLPASLAPLPPEPGRDYVSQLPPPDS